MQKDTKEGQTHFYGDNCGEPEHNKVCTCGSGKFEEIDGNCEACCPCCEKPQSLEEVNKWVKENEEPWEKDFQEYMRAQGAEIKKANGTDVCDCYEDDFHIAMMIASEYIREKMKLKDKPIIN